MPDLPTYVYPCIRARCRDRRAAARRPGARRRRSLPGWVLYAVAGGCVVVGLATLWLSHNA